MPALQAPEVKSFASTAELKASYAANRARLMGKPKQAEISPPPSPAAPSLAEASDAAPASIVHPEISDIVAAVAAAAGVAPSDLLGDLSAPATRARRIAIAVARRRGVAYVTQRFGVGAAIVHDVARVLDAILLQKSIAARFTPLDALVAAVVPLWDELDRPATRSVAIADIKRSVADTFGVTVTDLDSTRRNLPLVQARHVAMGLAKRLTTRSLPEIGRQFANRDHTTVLHAVRKYQALIDRVAGTLPANAALRDWALALHRALMPWQAAP